MARRSTLYVIAASDVVVVDGLADGRGLRRALDPDVEADQRLDAALDALHVVEAERGAHAATDGNGRREAQAVQAVVHAHADAADLEGAAQQVGQKGEGEVAVGD